eukprot:TRINITY_DN46164_c0_g1_i1.p1 TRINITY_DN46164_c0_g1~~TRINITY_DN46164_c0_g1_i1.p1  ORF type:complete len:1030 (+),score=336.40 TRINITY_DN46164_c0_g1_i1:71-3160(+)
MSCLPAWLQDDISELRDLCRQLRGGQGERFCGTDRPGFLTACVMLRDAFDGETLLPMARAAEHAAGDQPGDLDGIVGYAIRQTRPVRAVLVSLTGVMWLLTVASVDLTTDAVLDSVVLIVFLVELRAIFGVQGGRGFFRDGRCMMQLAAVCLAAASIRPGQDMNRRRAAPLMSGVSQSLFVLFRFAHLRRAAWDMGAVVAATIPTLTLAGLCVLIFATVLFVSFKERGVEGYATLYDSWTSILVLLTTANFPDTMFQLDRATSAHIAWAFVAFLVFTLYFLMNLVLAVVYTRYRARAAQSVSDRLELQRHLLVAAFRLLSEHCGPPRTAALVRGIERTPDGLFRRVVAQDEERGGSLRCDEYFPAPPELVDLERGPVRRRLRALLWHHIDDLRQPPGLLQGSWQELDRTCSELFGFAPAQGFPPLIFGRAAGAELQHLLGELRDKELVQSVAVSESGYEIVLAEEAHIPQCTFGCLLEALEPHTVAERCELLYQALRLTPSPWRTRSADSEGLSIEDFLNVLEVLDTRIWWRQRGGGEPLKPVLLNAAPSCPQRVLGRMRTAVASRQWRWAVNALLTINVVINYVFLVEDLRVVSLDLAFGTVYLLEKWVQVCAGGLAVLHPLKHPWDGLDCVVVHGNFVLAVCAAAGAVSGPIAVFPVLLRLPRLIFRLKPFRTVFGTFLVLLPRSGRLFVLLAMVFHVYACIGEVAFSGLLAGAEQRVPGWNETEYARLGFSPLNFDSLSSAYLTLFHLMVVNNWHVTMQAFVLASGTKWACVFFELFHFIVVVIVLNVLVAFVIEAYDLARTHDVLESAPSLWEQRILSIGVSSNLRSADSGTLYVRRPPRTWDFTRAMFRDVVADFVRRYKVPRPSPQIDLGDYIDAADELIPQRLATLGNMTETPPDPLLVPMIGVTNPSIGSFVGLPRAQSSFYPRMATAAFTQGAATHPVIPRRSRPPGGDEMCLPDPRARVGSVFPVANSTEVGEDEGDDPRHRRPLQSARSFVVKVERDNDGGFCFVRQEAPRPLLDTAQ